MNLKTAARRLGVHYQTAYRWVRSGQLIAVKVGAGYEISDAALARFQAQRAALERVPEVAGDNGDVAGPPRSTRQAVLSTLDDMADAPLVDPNALYARAARFVAEALGDVASVHICRDGRLDLVAYDHHDPRRAVLIGALLHHGRTAKPAYVEQAADTVEPVLIPQVPQRDVRTWVRPEFHQFLDRLGCYSAISAPIVLGGRAFGAIFAGRDAPGRPYTAEDAEFVREIAHRLALAAARGERERYSWTLRAHTSEELAKAVGEQELPDAVEAVVRMVDDEDAVAVLDLDLTICGATKGFADALDTTVSDGTGRQLTDLVEGSEEMQECLERVRTGELDFCSNATRTHHHPARRLALDCAVVRSADATPMAIVCVARPYPELVAA